MLRNRNIASGVRNQRSLHLFSDLLKLRCLRYLNLPDATITSWWHTAVNHNLWIKEYLMVLDRRAWCYSTTVMGWQDWSEANLLVGIRTKSREHRRYNWITGQRIQTWLRSDHPRCGRDLNSQLLRYRQHKGLLVLLRSKRMKKVGREMCAVLVQGLEVRLPWL